MKRKGWILRRRKEILHRRSDTEMPAAVEAEHPVGRGGPMVHDYLEIRDICGS